MDKFQAALEEIHQKAADSCNCYDLIMRLMKETPSKSQAPRGTRRAMASPVSGSPMEHG